MDNNDPMIINLIAAHQPRYLKYALICVDSLIRRGGVNPKSIHLTTNQQWLDHQAIFIMRNYGIVIEFRDHIGGKFLEMDRIFSSKKGYGNICQLDVDIILTSDFIFRTVCKTMLHTFDWACYLQPTMPMPIQNRRIIKDLVNPRFLWDSAGGRERFSAMTHALFGLTLQQYLDLLAHKNHWLFGGVILVNESFVGTARWNAMVAMNSIVHCDETVMALEFIANQSKGKLLDNLLMPHTVNPHDGLAAYLTKDHPGILHYAGDWYREQNENNKAILDNLYQSLVDYV